MAISDLISAWLLPFIALIVLYFARNYAIHRRWLDEPSNPPADDNHSTLVVLKGIRDNLRVVNASIRGHQEALVESLNDIKGTVDRLTELSEARERDGGMLMYQRVPNPSVSSAAVHLDGRFYAVLVTSSQVAKLRRAPIYAFSQRKQVSLPFSGWVPVR